ncbi:MAG: anti-sigma factor [Pseudomonadota bacterium]
MMTEHTFSDETLMAFADGELSADESEAVERAMEADEALALRVEAFMETRLKSQDALKPLLDEPVPEALRQKVEGLVAGTAEQAENVVPFPQNRPSAPVSTPRWAVPLAASVALVAGVAGGYWLGLTEPGGTSGLQAANLGSPGVVQALHEVASGKQKDLGNNERFRAIASYKDTNGDLCREFELDHPDKSTVVAVACNIQKTWKVQFTVVAAQNTEGYAPASSLEALNAYLTAVGASDPLSQAAERGALEALKP